MPEPLKDLAKSSEVLLPSGGEDDNIVQIEQERLPVKAGKDAVMRREKVAGALQDHRGPG